MIAHRAPPGIPINLLHSNERQALEDFGGTNWQKACHDAALRAIQNPDARLLREFGLRPSRKPGNLGERSLGDDTLGKQILLELAAKRQRGEP